MICKKLIEKSFILIFLIILFSCNREKEVKETTAFKHSKESLEEVNKLLVDKDVEIIKSYIQRREIDMHETSTGLWYIVDEVGNGEDIIKGKYVTINYEVWLLDGTLCYSSENLGPKSFSVGKGGVESGLEEGILMLKKGSKARFIMPPHLAHGLLGDENKIPARSIILYNVEVLSIED